MTGNKLEPMTDEELCLWRNSTLASKQMALFERMDARILADATGAALLRERIVALEAALEPFAAEAAGYDAVDENGPADGESRICGGSLTELQVEHLRLARSLLAPSVVLVRARSAVPRDTCPACGDCLAREPHEYCEACVSEAGAQGIDPDQLPRAIL